MIQGITFDKQKMKSEDMAHITNMFFQGNEGATKGCNISTDSNGDIVVSEGYFSVQGRLVKNVGNTIVEVPAVQSGVLYSILVFEVDLSQENEQDVFNQGQFKIISNATSYPTLTKQDLENGGSIYQLEFCRFQNTANGITDLSDTRKILSLDMYALESEVTPALATKKEDNYHGSVTINETTTQVTIELWGVTVPGMYLVNLQYNPNSGDNVNHLSCATILVGHGVLWNPQPAAIVNRLSMDIIAQNTAAVPSTWSIKWSTTGGTEKVFNSTGTPNLVIPKPVAGNTNMKVNLIRLMSL